VFGGTQVAIAAFKWWWKNKRRAMGKDAPPKLTLTLPNGTTVKFGDDGEIESVQQPDGMLIESS
jgi:hypothetical protein